MVISDLDFEISEWFKKKRVENMSGVICDLDFEERIERANVHGDQV